VIFEFRARIFGEHPDYVKGTTENKGYSLLLESLPIQARPYSAFIWQRLQQAAGARTSTYARANTDNPEKKARPVSRFHLVSFVCAGSPRNIRLRGRKSGDSA